MKKLDIFSWADVENSAMPAPLSNYNMQLLAQGDSWFSVGSFPPWATENLLMAMHTTGTAACAINFAAPGKLLVRMTDSTRDPQFLAYLNGRQARRWSGILLSGGGNDLIDAIQTAPTYDPTLRLLLKPSEWTHAPGAEKYLCNPGWQTFALHMTAVVQRMLAARDRGPNKGTPILLHSYDITTPRDAPAGLGRGPWLVKAVRAFGIPQQDWLAVARLLLQRLETLLLHIAATTADQSIHVIKSQGTLTPASVGDAGATTDWANEIHPSKDGYTKLGALWTPYLDALAP